MLRASVERWRTQTLLLLGLKAILIAGVPLLYVFRSRAPDKVRKLAWVTAFLTFDLILFGGFTRLTDSGLGCPDWPGCYGHSNPVSAGEHDPGGGDGAAHRPGDAREGLDRDAASLLRDGGRVPDPRAHGAGVAAAAPRSLAVRPGPRRWR